MKSKKQISIFIGAVIVLLFFGTLVYTFNKTNKSDNYTIDSIGNNINIGPDTSNISDISQDIQEDNNIEDNHNYIIDSMGNKIDLGPDSSNGPNISHGSKEDYRRGEIIRKGFEKIPGMAPNKSESK